MGKVREDPGRTEHGDAGGEGHSSEWLTDLLTADPLTPKGRLVGHFIAANPRYASFASASDVAERTSVNVATVVRLTQALGFDGWPEFQLHLRHNYLGSLLPSGVMRDHPEDDETSRCGTALRRDAQNLEALAGSIDLEKVAEVAGIIASAPKTLIVSGGSHAAPGLMLAHLSHFMGYDVRLETRGPVHIVAALSTLEPASKRRASDCVITINFWHVLNDVMNTADLCRREGLTTIAITDSSFSPLAKVSDHALVAPTESVSFFQSQTAAMSLVHGLLAELHHLGGAKVDAKIERLERAYTDLNVLRT